MLVALYAPEVDRKHLFYSVVCLTTSPRPFVLAPFGVCYTAALYVIAERISAVYTCLAVFNVAPMLK